MKIVSKIAIMQYLIQALVLACLCFQVTLSLKYYYGDGSYFIGDVDDHGRPSGHGEFHNTSGALEYDGEFFEGHPHGYGTWYGEDGTVFKGQFRYGRSSGKATYSKPNGDKLEGDFLNLRPHGSIVFTKARKDEDESSSNLKFEHKTVYHSEKTEKERSRNSKFDKGSLSSESLTPTSGNIIRIEGEFRNGMAHGNVQLWYRSSEGKVIRIEGVFRMGMPHGYFRFIDEDDTTLTEVKYLNGVPLENVHGRPNLKSKPYLFMIPEKIVL